MSQLSLCQFNSLIIYTLFSLGLLTPLSLQILSTPPFSPFFPSLSIANLFFSPMDVSLSPPFLLSLSFSLSLSGLKAILHHCQTPEQWFSHSCGTSAEIGAMHHPSVDWR